jgi:membrane-associated phospholipid phosphatase
MSVTGGLKSTGAQPAASWPRWFGDNLARGAAAIVRPPRVKATRVARAYARLLVLAVAALALIAAVMVFADAAIAKAVKHSPMWVLVAFDVVTEFGKSGWFLWPTGVLVIAIAAMASPALAPVHRLILAAVAVRAGFLFAAIAAPSLFVTVIKRLIGRARPFVGEPADPFLYMPMVWRAAYASLPSGHATTAFAAAVAFGLLWPRLRAPMLAYALVIAASRVVLDAHYLSDVITGAIAGSIGALLVRDWFAARRLGFAIGADGSVCTLPGPSWARLKRVARRPIAP